jgi:hypothetical protein
MGSGSAGKKAAYPAPSVRRLRVYAFDPQASTHIETAGTNVATIAIPWDPPEDSEGKVHLLPGPVNDYLEVIDIDPVSGHFYEPIDLSDPHLLARDGLTPTEGDPRFHQQMVFAVAMKTIKTFERALGRKVFWFSSDQTGSKRDAAPREVPKLRIFPHALREPNAYYSREKRALLFGYFRASVERAGANLPGGWVFTALSHDIIVHEATHAILDGLHPRFAESSGRDSLAFHEAFADIVALLLHFTMPEAVSGEIARKTGRLDDHTMLSDLARQFGEATGRYAALRSAIDAKGRDGQPDPARFDELEEPHERGAVLVAAIFDALVTIYNRRTADLMRLAHPGQVRGESRDLHPDLVVRLTGEAVKSADHLLRLCIRALDYLPPVEVTFGEFLRAIVTADWDLVPSDPLGYRLAIIQAFRRRGILPEDCLSLAPDSLLWEQPNNKVLNEELHGALIRQFGVHRPATAEKESGALWLDLFPKYQLDMAWEQAAANRRLVGEWLCRSDGDARDSLWEHELGVFYDSRRMREWVKKWRAERNLPPDGNHLTTISHWPEPTEAAEQLNRAFPAVQVSQVRTTRRTGPDGQEVRQLIIGVTQKRRGFLEEDVQRAQDSLRPGDAAAEPDFTFWGGATLIIDLHDGQLRYIIRKRINDADRLKRHREYLRKRDSETLGFAYRDLTEKKVIEPFALAHRRA